MILERRHLAIGAAAILAARALPAAAASADEEAVARAVDTLTRAMLDVDRAVLDRLTAPELSYGHSGGRIENKQEFIAALVNRTSVFKRINLSQQSVAVVGNDAIARHVMDADTESNGQISPVHIGILQVWVKRGGDWLLLARQAYRL